MAKQKHAEKMAALQTLVKTEVDKCIRCGECRTVCPVFAVTPSERYTARGKIAIAESLARGELEFTAHTRELFDNCLLCTGCVNQCSSGARADKVVIAVREAFADKQGIPFVKKAVAQALSLPGGALGAGARIGSMAQKLAFKHVPETSGLYRRFAMPLVDKDQYVPQLAATPFRSEARFWGKQDQPKVVFFTGCMTNYFMTEIGHSLVKVLNALNVAVEVPSEQACCGMPMLASGEHEIVRKQAKRNIGALTHGGSDVPIVTACASCGHMLKHGYLDRFGDDPELAPGLANIAERTMDITEFLASDANQDRVAALTAQATRRSATYHDPCHLRKAQKLIEEPRRILKMATGDEINEMSHPEACCGLGGTYCLANMERSKQIQAKKIEDAVSTSADVVATACPGCILQLRDGMRRREGADMPVEHIIQLLAEAIDA
ncbi:(Fe-S)-binding protein [Oceanidesulfovibrio marinus]|uniref:Glycolate oxidase iron-sulfur subunit n=1 Tax=Oceanidesulfovibrio marinus TaxID=370038 RepID=A0ABX6NG11_9BACT|nr:(Fe-S)-binding protein [Oceanidesulfovibrio marinus]QJT09523.1 (Fe-S)-binding protein [Oceanidesulfovibrio marinus]